MLLDEQGQQISLKLSEVASGRVEQQEQVEDAEDDTTISSLESDQEQSLPWISQSQLSSLGPSPSPDRTEDLPLSGGGKTFAQLMAEKLTGKENEATTRDSEEGERDCREDRSARLCSELLGRLGALCVWHFV